MTQGLFSSLSMAAHALDAQRAGLDVAGQNIANLNTPGYARRRISLADVADGTGGVEVRGTRAVRDFYLDSRVRQALPDEERQSAIVDMLSGVEATIGAPGGGIDGRLAAFFDSFSSLALDPTSAVARDGVLLQGSLLATGFREMAARLVDSRRVADNNVRGAVDEANTLVRQIAELNGAIATANGVDVDALKDRQLQAVESLSRLTSVAVMARGDGGVDVTVPNGQALVLGDSGYTLGITTSAGGFAQVSLGGTDITASLTGGRLGGFLQVRDTLVPDYQSRLDTLAFGVAQQVNALHQTGTDLNGNPGVAFFTPPTAVAGAAAAMQLNPAVQADGKLVAASGNGAPGDNQIARALANLRDAKVLGGGTATMSETWAQLTYRVGSDAESAERLRQSRHDVTSEVQRLRDQMSGVSLDEEAASMLKFQRAYEANAKFFTVVDQMLSTLMNIVGAV